MRVNLSKWTKTRTVNAEGADAGKKINRYQSEYFINVFEMIRHNLESNVNRTLTSKDTWVLDTSNEFELFKNKPKTVEVLERVLAYGIPRKYVSVNWSNNRSIISGLSTKGLFHELDSISEKASLSEMEFFTFFKEVYYETKLKKSKAKTKINPKFRALR